MNFRLKIPKCPKVKTCKKMQGKKTKVSLNLAYKNSVLIMPKKAIRLYHISVIALLGYTTLFLGKVMMLF